MTLQFEEQYKTYDRTHDEESGLIKIILTTGIVKNKNQAFVVLVVLLILFLTMSGIFLVSLDDNKTDNPGRDLINTPQPTQSL